jgi:uncharacterized membrane protein
VVTVFVLTWFVKLADAYIGPSSTFGQLLVTVFGQDPKYSYTVGYLVAVLLITLLGFLVTRATVARIYHAVNSTFARIPLFGKIYSGVGQVVALLEKKEQGGVRQFGGAVQIRIGEIKMLALLTSSERYLLDDGREYFLVYVPSSPVPATGFNMLVPVKDVELLNMPIEDLGKVLMSLGVLGPQVLKGPISRISGKKGNDGGQIS